MPDAATSATTIPRPKRRWFRYSLRTMLVAATVLCVLFGYSAFLITSARHQEAAVAEVQRVGGGAYFNYLLKNNEGSPTQAAWAPEWLRNLLGRHILENVQLLSFGDPNPNTLPPIGDHAMDLLDHFPGLRGLNLYATQITDRGLVQIEHCQELHYLVLWRNKNITDKGMKSVNKLRQLHTLEFYGPLITDEGLAHLKELPNLRELLLAGPSPRITDEGMRQIGKMTSLTLLELNRADVSDQGLLYLEGLAQLQELNLEGTKVTPEGVQRFQRVLPNCRITFK